LPAPRGPVSHVVDSTSTLPIEWCANDDVLVDQPSYEQPDLYFDAPPPSLGGIALEQTFGCLPCDLDDPQLALALDRSGLNPLEYTPWPVNTASGSLTEAVTDLRLAGPGIPFAWTRAYNSRDTTTGALGPGWSHPFEAKLNVANQTTGELEYRAGSGQRTRFTKISGGSSGSASYAGKGFDGTLKRLSDDSYEMTTRDRRTFAFDSSGNLTQIKPRFRPATTLAYSGGKLSSITDSAGRTITITYSASNPALIERVTLPDGRYVQYGYTGTSMTSVRDPRGKTWNLSHDGNGRLTSIQDPLGHYELQNVQYDGQGRVTSEQNGTGDTVGYGYSTSSPYDVTTVSVPGRGDWVYRHVGYMLIDVTDPLGRKTSYSYDGQARTATIKDGHGNTRRFDYDAYGNVAKETAPAPLGFSVERTFNSTNDLLTEKDGRGNTTAYAYATTSDANYQPGQLKTVTDREGGVTTLKYWTTTSSPTPPAPKVGLLKSLTNQRGKTTVYGYGSLGNLTRITSPLGLETTFTYDGSARLNSMRDPRGNVPTPPAGYLSQWTYDAADNVRTATDARGNVTTFDYYNNELLWKTTRTEDDGTPRVTALEYDGANRPWKATDPRSGVETRLYWPDGQLKSVQSPQARTTSYGYDTAGQLTSVVEPNGNVSGATPSDWTWTYGYDDAGNRRTESHPDAGTREIEYDALDRPLRWIDALNHPTRVSYDENSNVTSRTDALDYSRTFTYDKLNRPKTATDERNKTSTYTYHSTGELASATTPLGNKTTYSLDNDGRVTSMVEPRGNAAGRDPAQYTWSYGYDEAGNATQVADPLGNQLQYAYDAVNNVTQAIDQRSNATGYAYDSMNRLKRVTPPAAGASGTLDTTYGYDPDGNLATRTDPNGHITGWGYDLDRLALQRTTPIGTWNLAYDANVDLKTVETPAGSVTPTTGDGTLTYSYDRVGRQTGIDYSDSTPDVTRSYDAAGRPEAMTDGSGTVAYTFDAADRLTDIARSGPNVGLNGTLHYDYDSAGNITGRTYPNGTNASQTFDDDERLASVTSGGRTTSFDYDEAANTTKVTLPATNGYVATRTFDRAGRLTTLDNSAGTSTLSKFDRTLDPAGNPTKVKTTRGATDTYDAYEYDARNRLTASCFSVASSATDCAGAPDSITYAYDKVSNRTQEVRSGAVPSPGTTTYAYNAADQLTSTTKGAQVTPYTYDANGNQASIGTRTFSYDLANELVSTASGLTSTTYAYDGDGRRVSATTSGGADLRLVWDPLAESGLPELVLERNSSGGAIRRYLNGPLGAVSYTGGAGTFYYHRDPLGSVTDVTDLSGTAQWRYDYDAYGGSRAAVNVPGTAVENRLRFAGQYRDPETGHYHLRARQYDPASGRFGALDPVESPIASPYVGAYVYVDGRPTVLVDPLGLFGWNPIETAKDVGGDIKDKAVDAAKAVGNATAGAADTATLGTSTKGLNAVGVHPDTDSASFIGGQIVGAVALSAGGGAGAVAIATRLSLKGLKVGAAGLVGGTAAGTLLDARQAARDGRSYGVRDALAGAGFNLAFGVVGGRCVIRPLRDAADRGEGLLSRIGQRLASERGSLGRPTPLTNAQATDLARWNGFEPTNLRPLRGQKIFRKGNRYIVQDVDSHMGGTWKMANSPEALRSKASRIGTYDEQLNRIGP